MKTNKKILVSGCFGKIGYNLCLRLLHEGYTVYGLDIKSDKKKIRELIKYGQCFRFLKINLQISNIKEIEKLVRKKKICYFTHCSYPKLKISKNELNIDNKKFLFNIQQQLFIPLKISLMLINYFRTLKFGKIILLSSIQGISSPKFEHYLGTKMSSPLDYTIVKSSIISMTKYLAKKYGKYNININCISPGGIFANQNKKFIKKYNSSCIKKGLLNGSDISGSIIFLLSSDSNYINGQNIIVDDGWSL